MKAGQELVFQLQFNMLALIAAVAKNNCIGINNQLPWNIPEDLKHFKEITKGKTVMMGRKTFESILSYLGKPLPGRKSIVISRNVDYKVPEGVEIFSNWEEAVKKHANEEVFVIGGASLYAQTINFADTLYITHVNKEVNGDSFFPLIDSKKWKVISEEKQNGFRFATYKKI